MRGVFRNALSVEEAEMTIPAGLFVPSVFGLRIFGSAGAAGRIRTDGIVAVERVSGSLAWLDGTGGSPACTVGGK